MKREKYGKHTKFGASMFNTNILVSGGKHEDKIKYTYCTDTLCSDSYLPHMCFFDCTSKKFQTGTCIVPSPNAPLRCCCGWHDY
ncbi:hypothetical protein HID58_064503 [Brassica napus]|uniref:Defensin-like domain-containing protein n=1 Tax=Brassica napus TaxID=3708 RepID=A0ABQ7ZA62_BRANA|nr:hypothetical protein HID58_064503 [Brassica napus]